MITRREKYSFFFLALVIGLGTSLLLLFNYNRNIQAMIIAAMGVVYVLWGVCFHLSSKDFHLRILFEYLAVSIIASTLVIFLIQSA